MKKSKRKTRAVLLSFPLSALLLLAVLGFVYFPSKQYFSVFAMDTFVSGELRSSRANAADELSVIVESCGIQLDRFNEESEIFAANALPRKAVPISGYLYKSLKQLQEIRAEGALDITLGRLSDLWDFNGANPKLPDKKEIEKLIADKRGFELHQTSSDDYLLVYGTAELDLGSAAKGIVCDKILEQLRSWEGSKKNVKHAVISVGGSILLYGGNSFNVGIRSPWGAAGDSFAVIKMPQGNVSTSGSYERYFEQDGKRYHHILDPKTGYPVQNNLTSVTVISESGLLSDALSTACFVLGYEGSKELLDSYGAKAIFADENMQVRVYPLKGYASRLEREVNLGGGISLKLSDERYFFAEDTED